MSIATKRENLWDTGFSHILKMLMYGFSVNDIKYGHDIQLSNGYYYHAGQYGNKLQCFIYNSSMKKERLRFRLSMNMHIRLSTDMQW